MERHRKSTTRELELALHEAQVRNPEMPSASTASAEAWGAWDKAKRLWLAEIEAISFWLKIRRYEESHPECLVPKPGAKRGRKRKGEEQLVGEFLSAEDPEEYRDHIILEEAS